MGEQDMKDDVPAPTEYVLNVYILKGDFGKMRGPDLVKWLATNSDLIAQKKPTTFI
jgi:hypothetical protein